jgi:hypothetical protein
MEINEQLIVDRVLVIRGVKIMLDKDLAEMYGVELKRLNERVKRNHTRFPDDFMFQLSSDEWFHLKSHFATSRNKKAARKRLPCCLGNYSGGRFTS